MAAVPITIVGTITVKAPKEGGEVSGSGIEQCVINGIASLSDLSVGGGPIYPPEGGQPQPPSGAHPEHPIYLPPKIWGPPDMPPGFWGGGMGPGVKPQPPTDQPPTEPPPPIESNWKWAWNPSQGWHPAYVPEGGKPQPPPIGP